MPARTIKHIEKIATEEARHRKSIQIRESQEEIMSVSSTTRVSVYNTSIIPDTAKERERVEEIKFAH